jgi:catalase
MCDDRAMTSDLDEAARTIHDLLRAAPASSPTARALHAKGVVATGEFRASGALDGLTTATHLVSGATPVIARFSHPSGDPGVSDVPPSGRGLAVKLRTDDGNHDVVTVSAPAFPVRDASSFIGLLAARAPDPATGAPDPERMGAFLGAHPEALPAIEYALAAPIPASYATLAYHSLHSFFLVDGDGARQAVRLTWDPADGERSVTAEEAGALGPDFLVAELTDRLAPDGHGAAFDLVVHLGRPGDPTDDPTVTWAERPTLVAGRLELTRLADDPEPIIFDPNNVTGGLAVPDDDEVLALRGRVYGLSYERRTGS